MRLLGGQCQPGFRQIAAIKGLPTRHKTFLLSRASFHETAAKLNEIKLNAVPIAKTRNIGIIAHIDAGKTTTTERMLFYSGRTSRIGNVDEGDTVTDFLPSERERGITIQLAAISIPWNSNKINIIDTPGHADFTFEVIRSLRVLDGAVTILDGVAGVEAQTEKVWKQAQALNIPKIAYVNKMDRDGAGFSRTVREIIQKLQTRVVLCNIPYFSQSENDAVFSGVVDVIHKKLLQWDPKIDALGREITVIDLESQKEAFPELYDSLKKSRESMIETLGEFDENVIEAFFECDEDYMKVPAKVLVETIKKATLANNLTPVLCGSSFRNIGVQPLMDAVVSYLPTPLETAVPEISSTATRRLSKAKAKKMKASATTEELVVKAEMDASRGLIINNNPNLTVALAFKVMTHATRGVLTFFRVYSGKLSSNTTVMNTRTKKILNFRKVMIMHGDQPESVPFIGSGNIGVISGTDDDIITGDTLVSHGPVKSKLFSDVETNLKLLPIEIPPPLFNSSIEPLTAGDARHMEACIKSLLREDPSLKVAVDEDMGQTILSGMGELHLDIVRERLLKDMKANVRLREVAVSFKETLANPLHRSTVLASKDDENINVEVLLDSFEGPAGEYDVSGYEDAVVLEQENNIVVFENGATPQYMAEAIDQRRWKLEHSLDDLQETLIQGCATALQLGGPLVGLPLHSTIVRIKSWNFPVDRAVSLSLLLEISRRAVSKNLTEVYDTNKDSFTVLEPIMSTKVYVGSDVLGEVTHDLTHRCQSVILSIEDEATENLDAFAWANDVAERTYLPPDYTNKNGSQVEVRNKKIIIAETPLREMIGYLSRLRLITQGRGVFDMSYLGMRRAIKLRLQTLFGELM